MTEENPTGRISENFRWEEFHCRCGECIMPYRSQIKIQELVEQVLQPLRKSLGRVIHVGSGYRCEAHNKVVGGVPNSMHMIGACDFIVRDLDPKCAYTILDGHLCEHHSSSGLGSYPSFTHVDLRDGSKHARW